MSKTKQYLPGKIRPIVQLVAGIVERNPEMAKDRDWLWASVVASVEDLKDPEHCGNCGASMVMRITRLDINVALLLFAMAKEVRRAQEKGLDFTDANKVHVSSNPSITHACQCQTTKAAKLGLIAKAGNADWSITTRGWEALRGEPVPVQRVTFRGKIIERPEETTTLSAVFREHGDKMLAIRRRGKQPKDDHTGEFRDYRPQDYAEVAGIAEGKLW